LTLAAYREAITLKRLGIYLNAIVLVNVRGFFEPLITLFRHCIEHRFMGERHAAMCKSRMVLKMYWNHTHLGSLVRYRP